MISIIFRSIFFIVVLALTFVACLALLPEKYLLWSVVIAPIFAWSALPKQKDRIDKKASEQVRITPVLTRRGADDAVNSKKEETCEPEPSNGVRGNLFGYGILGLILISAWYAWGEYTASLNTPEALAAKEAEMARRESEKKLREAELKLKKENAIIDECKAISFAKVAGQCDTLKDAKSVQAALKSLNAVDPMTHCRQETRNRSKYPSKVDFSWSGYSEMIQYHDGSLVSIVNLSGETMNDFGLMVPFTSTCKIRKKLASDEAPVFYEFLIR